MSKFREVELGKLCKIIGGGTPSKQNREFYTGNIPWATVRDMNSELILETEFKITNEAVSKSSTNIIKKGSLIIATRVGLGKVCFAGTDVAINQDLKGIIVNDKISNKYLFFYFKNIEQFLIESGTGATVKGVKLDLIKNLKIPLPPLPEQQRIVTKLDGLFAKIEQAMALLEDNIVHTKALMGSVLDEEFGRLAEKFQTKTLPEVVKKDRHSIKRGPFGSALKKSFFVEKGFKVYEQKNAIKNDFSLGHYYIDDNKFEELIGFQIKPGDIIISCSGTIGKIAIAPKNIEKGIINQALLKISLDNSIISNNYFSYFFKNFVNQGELKTKGAAIKNIVSVKELKKIPFAVPNIEEQKRVVKKIKNQENLFETLLNTQTQKLNHLKALKSSLLDQAFKGEL